MSACDESGLEPFIYNGKFVELHFHDAEKGSGSFFIDGEVRFPPTLKPKKLHKFFRTEYGYNFPHNGQIFEHSNHNVRLASRRLFAKRFTAPGEENKDREYEEKQADFISEHMSILDKLRCLYAPTFADWSGWRQECIDHVDDPHDKRQLRQNALQDLIDNNDFSKRMWMKTALYKMKRDEIGKPGKKPRMIVDLGVAASLQGFRYAKLMKNAMADEILEYKGGTIEFCPKPNPDKLAKIFAKLRDPPGKFYFVYFSDDSCYAVNTPNGVQRFNVDIKSCDASHTASLFEALWAITPDRKSVV